MRAIKIALIGVGKIARDQHVPTIAADPAFELVAAVSPDHQLQGVRNYVNLDALLADSLQLDAVAICTPPQARYRIAHRALQHGLHVMLEKPPSVTLNEVNALIALATQKKQTLFAAWHSREAAGVEPARQWLAQRRIHRVHVQWKEDVRVWHPGQTWIWKAGGLGVFDPGINALSILTRILPGTLLVQNATLSFPANCQTPIAAQLQLATEHIAKIDMELDFLHTGKELWNIDIETDDGSLQLSHGGAVVRINGEPLLRADDAEYAKLYTRFAELIAARQLDVDITPLTLVADALICGQRIQVAPFTD